MKDNYHIFRNGNLKRDQNTLLLIDDSEEKHRIPIEKVECIYSHGQLDFNTRLCTFLNEKGVEVHIFGWNEGYSGSFVPKRGQVSGQTVINQVKAYNTLTHRQSIARKIVVSSIHNMSRSLSYYNRSLDEDFGEEMGKLRNDMEMAETTSNISDLMGYEASARKSYYNLFRRGIDKFEFNNREYNPPPNEINAVISYLNSLLYANCISAIRKTALDPTISYLHEPGERRYSLALDIADLFKPLITTRVCMRCFNRSQLSQDDFREEVESVLLSESGRKTVTREFEKQLEKTIEHNELNRHTSYQYLFQLDAYDLKKHLLTGETYTPFEKWW